MLLPLSIWNWRDGENPWDKFDNVLLQMQQVKLTSVLKSTLIYNIFLGIYIVSNNMNVIKKQQILLKIVYITWYIQRKNVYSDTCAFSALNLVEVRTRTHELNHFKNFLKIRNTGDTLLKSNNNQGCHRAIHNTNSNIQPKQNKTCLFHGLHCLSRHSNKHGMLTVIITIKYRRTFRSVH